jgi:predicted RNase H-like HicB family nuclease
MKFRLTIQRDDDGFYVAEVPALPGCVSQGTTPSAALDNVREALALYLESLKAHGDSLRRRDAPHS